MTNGSGGHAARSASSGFADMVRLAPDDVIHKWVQRVQETHNIHPNPEADLDELRAWLITAETLIPTLAGQEIVDPFFGGTQEDLARAEAEIDRREQKRKEEQLNIKMCAQYKLTDFGNCDRFITRYGDYVRYCAPWKQWYCLNEDTGIWIKDERGKIAELAKDTLISIYGECEVEPDPKKREMIAKWAITCEKSSHLNEVMNLASTDPNIVIMHNDLDADQWKIAFSNGVYNLKDHTFKDPKSTDLHSKYIPVAYDPRRKAPEWSRFLERIFKSREDRKEIIEFLQKAAGYCLSGDRGEQCVFFLYGSGANGKSVFLEVLREILGGTKNGYAAVVDPVTFTTERIGSVRSDIARLAGARVVTTNENPKGSTIDEAMIKQVTGEKEITACFKFKDEFTFEPQFKLWWAFNHRPQIRDVTNSIWRRIHLIAFEEQIPAEEQIQDLAQVLISQELPGIINWAIEGLKKYQVEGLKPPAGVQQATNEYRQDSDILHDFITLCCSSVFLEAEDPGAQQSLAGGLLVQGEMVETARRLYQAYSEWTIQFNERKMSQTKFGRELQERGYKKGHTKKGNIYHGIQLKAEWSEILHQ